MIRGENLKKTFGGQTVFEQVDFMIPAGITVGFCGASGIGKSTLAKLLCGVLQPDEGRIYLDGQLLCAAGHPYDRKRGLTIQMVYQQPYAALDHHQKLIDGFRELIRYHKFEPDRKQAESLIRQSVEEVGLTADILNHLPHQISGGEAQRISIARSLLFKPRLLILDEATSMLDVSTQANVLGMVRRVMAKHSGSVLLISHDDGLINRLCDKIYLFDQLHLKEKHL